jgi:outer membrane protein assembly factor BamB
MGTAFAQGEGDLGNDSFQPFQADAELSFQNGADLLERARATSDTGLLGRSFELIREAIARSTTGEGVRIAEDAASPMSGRLLVGIEERVWMALHLLSEDEQVAWDRRFADLSAAAFGRGDLRACERNFPGTPSAVRAALRLADEALEVGRPEDAQMWCLRAARHLAFLDTWTDHDAALTAMKARQLVADRAQRKATASFGASALELPTSWVDATSIPTPLAIPFEYLMPEEDPFLSGLSGTSRPRSSERGPGLGVRPGLAVLDESRIAIQTGSGVHLIDLAASRRQAVFDPAELVEKVLGRVGRPRAARKGGAPGWPHLPLTVPSLLPGGDGLVLVTGRHDPLRGPNAILCVDLPKGEKSGEAGGEDLDLADASEAPVQTRWILSGNRLWSHGNLIVNPILQELGECEIQPGTATVGDRLFVSVRTLDGEVRSWLLALDLASGTPLWKRLLAKGSDLEGGAGRFTQGSLPIGAAQALVALDGMLFVGTHLGIGALLDATDGRLLWSYKNKRRKSSEPGWGGAAPIVLPPSMASGGLHGLLWAPADSDYLYTLRAGALPPDTFQELGPTTSPPTPIGEATDLLAGDGDRILTYSRAGANQTLAETRMGTGQRIDSIYLRQSEAFVGQALSSKSLVLASSNRGLFLFDRTRDLQLLDFTPLPTRDSDPFAGGAAYAVGERVVILGPGTLWILDEH